MMDFIPLPDGVSSHEPVPELRGFDYDNKGFIGYDQREGWNVQALRQGWPGKGQADWFKYGYRMYSKGDPENLVKTMEQVSKLQAFAASFVQTWILYGLFQEALKRKIQRCEIAFEAVALDEKASSTMTRPWELSSPESPAVEKLVGQGSYPYNHSSGSFWRN